MGVLEVGVRVLEEGPWGKEGTTKCQVFAILPFTILLISTTIGVYRHHMHLH